MNKLNETFYLQKDVIRLSRLLLGMSLFTRIKGKVIGGIITETEAYKGSEDKACHAYNNRRTKRTEVMFHKGGICYVYLCYGMHYLLNIVTNQEEVPHAILIRALSPQVGIDTMLQNRKKKHYDSNLTMGPGKVAQALGIDSSFNGESLLGKKIWIEKTPFLSPFQIEARPRVGVGYAQEDAFKPWRFILK